MKFGKICGNGNKRSRAQTQPRRSSRNSQKFHNEYYLSGTQTVRKRMTSIARQLHGAWTDFEHPDHPKWVKNSYDVCVELRHTHSDGEGRETMGEQRWVKKLGGSYMKLHVYSHTNKDWILEDRRAFSFRADSWNPEHILMTDVHVKSKYRNSGHTTFIMAAAIDCMKENGFKTVSIDSPSILRKKTYCKIGFNSKTRTQSQGNKAGYKAYLLDLEENGGWSIRTAKPSWKRDKPKCIENFRFNADDEAFAYINSDGYFSQIVIPPVPENLRMLSPSPEIRSGCVFKSESAEKAKGESREDLSSYKNKLQFLKLSRNPDGGKEFVKCLRHVPPGLWVSPDLPASSKRRGPLPRSMKIATYLCNKYGKVLDSKQTAVSVHWPVDSRNYGVDIDCSARKWLPGFCSPVSSMGYSRAINDSSTALSKFRMRFYCRTHDVDGNKVAEPEESPFDM